MGRVIRLLAATLMMASAASAASRVWFVDNSRAAGDGSESAPFSTLAAVESAAAEGDTIVLVKTATMYRGPIHLKNGQVLSGRGGRPAIEAAAQAGIVLASSNQ